MSRLRGAMVGFGFIAERGHLPAYLASERFDIVAVADTCPARREQARARLKNARIYESHESLLAHEAKTLDFVDVATPPAFHAPIAHAALDAGLHVLSEKPLATSGAEARAMLEHAERARRVVMPAHNYKHAPVVRAVRRAIDSGAIGEVQLVTLLTLRNTHAKGVAEWRPDWRRELSLAGGGIGMDHGSHTFYLAFDWLGAYPTAITAKASRSPAWDTEDDLTCTLTFPGGRLANAHLTWRAGMRKVLYTIQGTRGAIRVEDDDLEIASLVEPEKTGAARWKVHREAISSDWMDASHSDWFRSLFDKFAGNIDQGQFVAKEAVDGLASVELIGSAYESARKGSAEVQLRIGR